MFAWESVNMVVDIKFHMPHRRSPDFQNISFDWSVEKCHCQINVVGRYVLISKMNFYLFPHCSFYRKLFYKSNRKLFSCVCIAWYKHSRGWENSRQLCKPETKSQVCITVSNSPNPSCVYIRLCKHRKHFLLLNYTIGSQDLKHETWLVRWLKDQNGVN